MGEQMPLIPLTEEQLRERSRLLANMHGEYERMEKRHQEQREEMREERRRLFKSMSRCAEAIRVQGEPGE